HPALTEVPAHVLKELGSRAAFVVRGHGGLDELTLTGPNRDSRFGTGTSNCTVVTELLDPRELAFALAEPAALRRGAPEENAQITRAIRTGADRGPRRDIVLLNAAAALLVGGAAESLQDGVAWAAQSIDSGAAWGKLESLVLFSLQCREAA